MEYTILVHKAEEGGYWSEVPALPGCFSQGETIEETLENTKEAIESHLMALAIDNLEIPVDEDLFIGRIKVDAAIS
jgi:predicted RNase H-like HicB family nuclease